MNTVKNGREDSLRSKLWVNLAVDFITLSRYLISCIISVKTK